MAISLLSVMNKQSLQALKILTNACEQADKVLPRIYWDLITIPRSPPSHYVYMSDDQLIGYLSYYLFMTEEVEASVLVHPDHRRQGIFTKLLAKAVDTLKPMGIKAIQFSTPQGQPDAEACLTQLGATLMYTEHQMQRNLDQPESSPSSPLHFSQASLADAELLAKLDHACFNSDMQIMQERFYQILPESHRYAWIIYLNRQPVGKAHIRLEPEQAYIHDMGILPEFQGKGYGTLTMQYLFNWLLRFGYKRVYLEVMQNNQPAINLYQKLGFSIIRTDEYWKLEI